MQAVFSSKRDALVEGIILSGNGLPKAAIEDGSGLRNGAGISELSEAELSGPKSVEHRKSAAERVYEAMRQSILTLEIGPGYVLSRAGLAGRYNVSQTPVREALLRLEQDGLVEVFPQASTQVSRIELRGLFEAQFQRIALEVEVVRRLARRPDAPGVLRARELFEQQMQIWHRAEVHSVTEIAMEMARLDNAFHGTLFDGIGMGRVFAALFANLGPLDRCRAIQPLSAAQQGTALKFHGDILTRIQARDPAGAEAAMRAHLADGLEGIALLAKQHPDYFK